MTIYSVAITNYCNIVLIEVNSGGGLVKMGLRNINLADGLKMAEMDGFTLYKLDLKPLKVVITVRS